MVLHDCVPLNVQVWSQKFPVGMVVVEVVVVVVVVVVVAMMCEGGGQGRNVLQCHS